MLCATKEDQQRWIELLIQEQRTNSSLVKSSTTSRVSCNLPPYTRLSRYFAKLVKKKIIRPELLKKLLYLQYILKPDLTNVKMRKPNVTTYALYPMPVSDRYRSSDIETSKIIDQQFVGTSTLRKSTLTLDVKYALGDLDLSTVGIANDSTLTESVSERNSIHEVSKSLPVAGNVIIDRQKDETMTHVANFPLSFPIGRDVHRSRLNAIKKHVDVKITANCWKSIEPNEEQPTTIISAQRPIVCACNEDCKHRYAISTRQEFDSCTDVSVNSLDSGMAESCRLNSSEIDQFFV